MTPPRPGTSTIARPHRNRTTLFAAGGVVLLIALLVGGYVGFGYGLAQGRLQDADRALDAAHDHQLAVVAFHNALVDQLRAMDLSDAATIADLQKAKATNAQIGSQDARAVTQMKSDDAELASAKRQLRQDQWLTGLSRRHLDRDATRIDHMRSALAIAMTLNADYVQDGKFFDANFDVVIDDVTGRNKADASDWAGAAAATEQLRTDLARAMQLDKAPGLPPEVDKLLQLVQSWATDYANLLNAVFNNDDSAYNSADAAQRADANKLADFDYRGIEDDFQGFYQPLIDEYQAEFQEANKP